MSQPYTRPIAQADLAFAAEKTSQRIQIFLAGPIIRKEWTDDDWKNARASSRLRLDVKNYVEKLGHSVILGEHRGVKEMADDTLPSTQSAVVSETYLAAQRCHCIVMIPDSPGSFCELGAWAGHEIVASKMLILADGQYEHEISYVNPSVFALATKLGARLKWVDYADPSSAIPQVDQFISDHQERAFIREVLHGSSR